MRNLCRSAAGLLRRIYSEERGATMIEYVLIIAAIALPVLAIVLLYRNDLMEWLKGNWDTAKNVPDATAP
jgi:Flp pilus assembly pilin Flp